MRVGRASRRKPGFSATDASRESRDNRTDRRVQAEGASRTPGLRKSQRRSGRRKLEGSTKGRDGGRDARRKPRELADGKPETGSTHAARLSTMKAPEAPASGVFVFGRLPVGIVAKGLCGAPWIFCSGDEDRRSTTVGRMPRMVRAPVPRPRATKAYALRPPVMCGLDQLRESMGRPCRVFWK
jgi:hypothetical protein